MIGSEVNSACLKSSLIDVVELLVGAGVAELADREARIGRLRGARPPQAPAPTRSCDLGVVAGDLEAEQGGVAVARRSARCCPARRGSRSPGCRAPAARRRCTSATAARKAGSVAVAVSLWISTSSSALLRERASSIACVGAPGLADPELVAAGASSSRPRRRSRRRGPRTRASPRSPSCGAWRSSARRGRRGCGADSSLGLLPIPPTWLAARPSHPTVRSQGIEPPRVARRSGGTRDTS